MLPVTESALKFLADALGKIEEPKPPSACFRVVPAGSDKLTLPSVDQRRTIPSTNERG